MFHDTTFKNPIHQYLETLDEFLSHILIYISSSRNEICNHRLDTTDVNLVVIMS